MHCITDIPATTVAEYITFMCSLQSQKKVIITEAEPVTQKIKKKQAVHGIGDDLCYRYQGGHLPRFLSVSVSLLA